MNGIRITTRNYFDGMVHHFCKVTAATPTLAFVIRRKGIFRGPVADQIEKPQNVTLSETDDCVIIKDGYAYELKKEAI